MIGTLRSISLGFVIYKPELTLVDRIILASELGFKCYIFDNSPSDRTFNESFNGRLNCFYLTSGKNAGLGFGISCVCGQAYYNGESALLFFDQDTIFDCNTLEFIERFYKENLDIVESYSSVVFNCKSGQAGSVEGGRDFVDVLLSISSGSLFFLERLKDLNWHNHSYFVDCVDYEFCLNSSNNGLKIGECSNTPGFDHVSEQADSAYSVFGRNLMLRKYSSSRVWGTIIASTRLFCTSIRTLNIKFAYHISRSLIIYLYFQLIVRVLNFFR